METKTNSRDTYNGPVLGLFHKHASLAQLGLTRHGSPTWAASLFQQGYLFDGGSLTDDTILNQAAKSGKVGFSPVIT